MAYAAWLGETDPRYYDTAAAAGPIAHPVFPVCYEWPVSRPVRLIPQLAQHFPRLVHAEHDLVIHRPARAGDRLATTATIRAVAQRKPGAFVVFRFETRDAAGAPVSTTDFGALYRGVAVDGPDAGPIIELPSDRTNLESIGSLDIASNAAHVYTECARIYNPIHTDIAHARSAGLPGIILHGTMTLALSVSKALEAYDTDPIRVRRVRCRFSGMVLMPGTLQVFGSRHEKQIRFGTRKADGEPVVSRGILLRD